MSDDDKNVKCFRVHHLTFQTALSHYNQTYLKKQVCSNFYPLKAVAGVLYRFAIDRTLRKLQKLPSQPM